MSMGEFMKSDYSNAPGNVAFRLAPKRGQIKLDDIYRELFEWGASGNLYAILLRIPEEFPVEDMPAVNIYEPYDAAAVCADWERYTLVNGEGQVITGDKDKLLELWGYKP